MLKIESISDYPNINNKKIDIDSLLKDVYILFSKEKNEKVRELYEENKKIISNINNLIKKIKLEKKEDEKIINEYSKVLVKKRILEVIEKHCSNKSSNVLRKDLLTINKILNQLDSLDFDQLRKIEERLIIRWS